jgi:hypothetical protein
VGHFGRLCVFVWYMWLKTKRDKFCTTLGSSPREPEVARRERRPTGCSADSPRRRPPPVLSVCPSAPRNRDTAATVSRREIAWRGCCEGVSRVFVPLARRDGENARTRVKRSLPNLLRINGLQGISSVRPFAESFQNVSNRFQNRGAVTTA